MSHTPPTEPVPTTDEPPSALATLVIALGLMGLVPGTVAMIVLVGSARGSGLVAVSGSLAVVLGFATVLLGSDALPRLARRDRGKAIVGVVSGAASLVLGGVGFLGSVLITARSLGYPQNCAANLSGLGKACYIYSNDHDEAFPAELSDAIEPGAYRVLQCPLEGDPNTAGGDYTYVSGLVTDDANQWPLAWCDRSHYGDRGAMVLFVDGHAEFVDTERFEALRDAFVQEYAEKYGLLPTILAPEDRGE